LSHHQTTATTISAQATQTHQGNAFATPHHAQAGVGQGDGLARSASSAANASAAFPSPSNAADNDAPDDGETLASTPSEAACADSCSRLPPSEGNALAAAALGEATGETEAFGAALGEALGDALGVGVRAGEAAAPRVKVVSCDGELVIPETLEKALPREA
jgi:hypothetical protein